MTIGPMSDLLPTSTGYYYVESDGTTSWIGTSPAATYSSYTTKTVEITIFPVANPEVTVTQTTVVTIMPPAVTAAGSSIALDEETTTSTMTSYLTQSVVSIHTVYMTPSQTESQSILKATSALSSLSVAGGKHTPYSHDTLTGPPTTTTMMVEESTISESLCSVSYVDVTSDITYTVLATPSSDYRSAAMSAGNLNSLVSPSPISNATMHRSPTISSMMTWSVSAGAVSQKVTPTASSLNLSPAYGYGANISSVLRSPVGYVPSVPISATPLSAAAALSRTSSTLTKIYTNTSISVMPTPSVCGEHGDFTLTVSIYQGPGCLEDANPILQWEDEPNFLPTTPITNASEAPPVFNPYHHMYFSDGFVYAPPPSVPFAAISSPRLVMFLANGTGDDDNHSDGGELSGEIGAGTRRSSNAFWFNAYSAYLGCDNNGPEDCTLQVTGLVYQDSTKSEVAAFQQNVTQPPCLYADKCQLTQVHFAQSMKGLSGIRIQAFVGSERRSWFMDNLALGWFNNTCEAGLLRGRSE
jgi:hypothetical protein